MKKMKKMLTILMYTMALSLVFHACSEEETDPAGSGDGGSMNEFTPGIYCALSADLYMDGTISGDSQSGICMSEDESLTTESACTTSGGMWMDVASLFCEFCATFSEDGSFVDAEGVTGTWELEENNMTINRDAMCFDGDYEVIEASDEAACETAGGDYDDAETMTATFANDMLTLDMIPDTNCDCDDDYMGDCGNLNATACGEAGGVWGPDGPAFSVHLGEASAYNECEEESSECDDCMSFCVDYVMTNYGYEEDAATEWCSSTPDSGNGCLDSCGSDTGDDDDLMMYAFENDFGQSTVSYTGQVVRNLIINDIKDADASAMMSMYDNDASNQLRTIAALSDMATEQSTYGEISSSNLSGKIAKTDGCLITNGCNVEGYSMDPDQLVQAWFGAAASGDYSADGLDVRQMIQKLLIGTVSYYQGTSKYLSVVLDQDNSGPDGDNTYTKMEHYWDEAFGYFGASRDYMMLDDATIKSPGYSDYNNNGVIDYASENSTSLSINAAKRDIGSDYYYDFTHTIMGAFIEGRSLISNNGSTADIQAQITIIQNEWEKVLAANTIHYINDTTGDIGDGSAWTGTETAACVEDIELCQDYSKHYSEMRAFALGLHFNDYKLILSSDLASVYNLMGTAPIWIGTAGADATLAFKADLLAARDILQTAYGFDANVVAGW